MKQGLTSTTLALSRAVFIAIVATAFSLAPRVLFADTTITYNPVTQFSTTSNPSGTWAYGWQANLGGAFTPFAIQDIGDFGPGLDMWNGPDNCPNYFPFVAYNKTGATLNYAGGVSQPANMLNLHPSCSGKFCVVRWTAPTAGWFKVTGQFQLIDTRGTPASSDVHILQNSSTSLLSANINGFGATASFDLLRYVAVGDTLDFAVGFGSNGAFWNDSTGLALTITAADTTGPVTTAATLTPNPAPVNQLVALAATVDDANTGMSNIHSAEYSVDGGPFTAMSGTFDSPTITTAAVIPAFSTPGVYSVSVRGTDAAGNVGQEYVVPLAVYDPDGGFVTGGGWIMSPQGAYTPNATLGGKATFGFVSKYEHGADVPTGSTQFVFHAGGFRFQSTAYDWLVVAGARAKYKGLGSINGQPGFRFMLSAIDGNLLGGGSRSDTVRLKVEDQDGNVIYDNQLGAADGDDPVTELGGGSIVIHKP